MTAMPMDMTLGPRVWRQNANNERLSLLVSQGTVDCDHSVSAMTELHTSDSGLALRLMQSLQRYRARSLSSVATARFFVTAIKESAKVRECEYRLAAAAYRIDPFILEKLEELGKRVEHEDKLGLCQIHLTDAERRWLSNVFPEVVRQVAKVESRHDVSVLTYALGS